MALTKTFNCDDGGLYYVREIGSNIFWLGEHRDNRFANVFFGQRSGSEISGQWFDIPKGLTRSSGEIRLSVGTGDSSMNRISETGGFGGSIWRELTIPPMVFPFPNLRAGTNFLPANHEARGALVLTGTWMGNDGGTYYVRQIDNRIIWLGESRGFTNVFNGVRSGNTITGRWADVPKGRTNSAGDLVLTLTNDFTLERSEESGGFGGSLWRRVQSIKVDISLDTLILHETEDSGGDEPFLWTVFIKVDGDTFELGRGRNNGTTVRSTSGSHRNLTHRINVRKGTHILIPDQVGRFNTFLKTVRGLDPFSVLTRDITRLGFLVFAFDQDGTNDEAIEAGRIAMVNTLQTELDRAVRRLGDVDEDRLRNVVQEAVRRAIRAATPFYDVPGLVDPDDQIGIEARHFSFAELIDAGGIIPLDLHFRNDIAHYQIIGSIRIDNGPVRRL